MTHARQEEETPEAVDRYRITNRYNVDGRTRLFLEDDRGDKWEGVIARDGECWHYSLRSLSRIRGMADSHDDAIAMAIATLNQ